MRLIIVLMIDHTIEQDNLASSPCVCSEKMKDKTGVNIDYPLIADVDKKLAEEYDILHKTRGVTYRGVFVIDPDGILRFSATYPLDVGRSTKEVERIIKVLQRAKELNHLKDLDRARELSRYNE